MEKKEYLNIGCGNATIENAINMDIVKNEYTYPDVVGSVLDIPFPDERFKGVIFFHVLEHLSLNQHHKAMQEIWRVLKPKGKLLIEVPDFEQFLKNYLENYLGRKEYWYMGIFGRQIYESDTHLSGITKSYLTDLLFANGFSNLRWKDSSIKEAGINVLAEKVEKDDIN